jgi:hypothetical protein
MLDGFDSLLRSLSLMAVRAGFLDSETNGWSFYLFVRTDPEATFAFLGRVHYVAHSGDRPIGITWKLDAKMPALLYERYATLRPG